jgi:hypothetical protein
MALNDVAIAQFRDQFINVYQQMSRKLAGTVVEVRGVTGASYQFPIAGDFVLHERGAFHSKIPSTPVDYEPRVITFKNLVALVPSDIFEQAEVNASERQNLAKSAAYAISRSEDQTTIDALDAASTYVVPDGGTNLTVDKVRLAMYKLDEKNVPAENRHIAAHANQKQFFLDQEAVKSFDFNTQKALAEGDLTSFMGFTFHWFGDMQEGGLKKVGDIRTCYAWHMDAMGQAYSLNPTVTVDWLPENQSWAIVAKVRTGAVSLKDDGIVTIECDEA